MLPMTRELYRRITQECLAAAEKMGDAGERVKMLDIARAYMGLADYMALCQDHGTAHRSNESQDMHRFCI
jgi:hypothetical protein